MTSNAAGITKSQIVVTKANSSEKRSRQGLWYVKRRDCHLVYPMLILLCAQDMAIVTWSLDGAVTIANAHTVMLYD
jgi:hypothetical protein